MELEKEDEAAEEFEQWQPQEGKEEAGVALLVAKAVRQEVLSWSPAGRYRPNNQMDVELS